MNQSKIELIFDKGNKNNSNNYIPKLDLEQKALDDIINSKFLRKEISLPDIPEVEIVRHYTNLSHKNYGVDTGIYPLGSCTMKYNPKILYKKKIKGVSN